MPRSLLLSHRTRSLVVSLFIQYSLIVSVSGLPGLRAANGQAQRGEAGVNSAIKPEQRGSAPQSSETSVKTKENTPAL